MARLILTPDKQDTPALDVELKDGDIYPLMLTINEPIQLWLKDGGILFIGPEIYNKSIITIRP